MTVFALQGSRISTNQDGYITNVAPSILEVITRTGTNSLEVAYLDEGNPNTVSLSDFNLMFDGVHINDGTLPEQIEYFDLKSDDGGDVRVLNFVFTTDAGMEEAMYTVGASALPAFRSPAETSAFFAKYAPEYVSSPEDLLIHLDQAADVVTKGVFVPIDAAEFDLLDEADTFEFLEQDPADEVQDWSFDQAEVAAMAKAKAGQLQSDGTYLNEEEAGETDWSPDDTVPSVVEVAEQDI